MLDMVFPFTARRKRYSPRWKATGQGKRQQPFAKRLTYLRGRRLQYIHERNVKAAQFPERERSDSYFGRNHFCSFTDNSLFT
jgi:hypothetical protein